MVADRGEIGELPQNETSDADAKESDELDLCLGWLLLRLKRLKLLALGLLRGGGNGSFINSSGLGMSDFRLKGETMMSESRSDGISRAMRACSSSSIAWSIVFSM